MTKTALGMSFFDNRAVFYRFLYSSWGIADARTPAIENTNYSCCTVEYVVSGKGYLDINGKHFVCSPGDVYFLPPGSDHRYWPDRDEPWHKLFFNVEGSGVLELLDFYKLTHCYHIPQVPHLRSYFDAMLTLGYDEESNRRSSILFHEFLSHAGKCVEQPGNGYSEKLLKLKKALDAPVEERFRLEEFAAAEGVSAAHLVRLFRKEFGIPPGQYRMRLRLDAATQFLRFSDLSIKEIADRLGFADQYTFSGCFKRHTGYSPIEYRKNKIQITK